MYLFVKHRCHNSQRQAPGLHELALGYPVTTHLYRGSVKRDEAPNSSDYIRMQKHGKRRGQRGTTSKDLDIKGSGCPYVAD